MKPIREQPVAALGYKDNTLAHYRDFTLIAVAGLGVVYEEIFAMVARAGTSIFDRKVAIGCFADAAACVALTTNRLLALFCAVMTSAVLLWGAFWTRDTARLSPVPHRRSLPGSFLGLVVKFV